eukprot:g16772.t1
MSSAPQHQKATRGSGKSARTSPLAIIRDAKEFASQQPESSSHPAQHLRDRIRHQRSASALSAAFHQSLKLRPISGGPILNGGGADKDTPYLHHQQQPPHSKLRQPLQYAHQRTSTCSQRTSSSSVPNIPSPAKTEPCKSPAGRFYQLSRHAARHKYLSRDSPARWLPQPDHSADHVAADVVGGPSTTASYGGSFAQIAQEPADVLAPPRIVHQQAYYNAQQQLQFHPIEGGAMMPPDFDFSRINRGAVGVRTRSRDNELIVGASGAAASATALKGRITPQGRIYSYG